MKSSTAARLLQGALVLLTCAYLVGPFVWLVGASLMTEPEYQKGRWMPRKPSASNYLKYVAPNPKDVDIGASTARSFARGMLNSLIVAVCVTALNVVAGGMAAYGLARIPTRANMGLLLFYLVSRSVPAVALMIPMFLLMHRAGMLDQVGAVILAHCTFTLPFTIWLLRAYFQTVPVDLERAARVDGCSRIRALVRVFVPVTAPGIVAAGTFAFIASWGEFLYALLFTMTMRSKTLPVVASDFIAEIDIPFPLIAAGGVLAVILPVTLAFIFQRFIVRGIGGAVTG